MNDAITERKVMTWCSTFQVRLGTIIVRSGWLLLSGSDFLYLNTTYVLKKKSSTQLFKSSFRPFLNVVLSISYLKLSWPQVFGYNDPPANWSWVISSVRYIYIYGKILERSDKRTRDLNPSRWLIKKWKNRKLKR